MDSSSWSNRTVQLAFGAAIVSLLIVGGISYRAMQIAEESERWVRHTQGVLTKLEELALAVVTVEASGHGFVLTGQQSFLDAFHASASLARREKAALRELITDSVDQQAEVTRLDSLVDHKIAWVALVTTLRHDRGMAQAAATIRAGTSPRLTAEFLASIARMKEEELRLLALRDATAQVHLSQLRLLLLLGTALGLMVAVAAVLSVERDAKARGLAERALRDSDTRHQALLDGIHDYGIYTMDPEGSILSWNSGAERIAGFKAVDVIGRNFSLFFPPEEVARGRPAEILRITAARGRYEEQALRTRVNGARFVAIVAYRALHDSAGHLQGFSAIGHDLAESEDSGAKYRALLEAAPDAMVVVNQEGDIVLLNFQAEKRFGYSRDELVGQKVKNIIPDGFAERLIADGTRSASEALAQQIGTGIELSGRRKDGSTFPIEIMLSPLEGADGVLVTAAIRDISVRKAADLHLAQMEGRYRGLLEAAPDAMVVVNQAGEIVLLNVQAEKQFGYRRDELLRQQVTNIIPAGFAERLIADALRSTEAALAQQIGTGIELTGRRKNGSDFPIEIMLSPLESTEGTLVTAAIRNITTRKEAQAFLLGKLDELKRSNEELEQFAAIASHDLQEPLRMVASYTQLLSRRYKGRLDADADDFIGFAVDGASRMQRLIHDLLAYSRVGTTGKDLRTTSADDALEEALLNLRGAIESSGAVVTHDHLPLVLADEVQLVQLFQNLIGNGIKYQNPGVPRIHVSAARNGGKTWNFAVRDNGLGIDALYFTKIFGMFQRLHKREEFDGTGIGLAICKKIVERHGGHIAVESQAGVGSTFTFALMEADGMAAAG